MQTITHSLNKEDRLGVVSYSSNATTLFQLLPMTKTGKDRSKHACDQLRPEVGARLAFLSRSCVCVCVCMAGGIRVYVCVFVCVCLHKVYLP